MHDAQSEVRDPALVQQLTRILSLLNEQGNLLMDHLWCFRPGGTVDHGTP